VRDKLGNAKLCGGDKVAAAVTKGTKQACVPRVLDHGDGTYALMFTLTEPGEHLLQVFGRYTIRGTHLSPAVADLPAVKGVPSRS
jgi:hypothetical protein